MKTYLIVLTLLMFAMADLHAATPCSVAFITDVDFRKLKDEEFKAWVSEVMALVEREAALINDASFHYYTRYKLAFNIDGFADDDDYVAEVAICNPDGGLIDLLWVNPVSGKVRYLTQYDHGNWR